MRYDVVLPIEEKRKIKNVKSASKIRVRCGTQCRRHDPACGTTELAHHPAGWVYPAEM